MKLFRKTAQRGRRRPLREQSQARPQTYTDYYRSESKRPMRTPSTADSSSREANVIRTSRRTSTKRHIQRLPTYIALIIITISLLYSSIINNKVIVLLPEGQGLHDVGYYQTIAARIMSTGVVNKTKFTFDAKRYKQQLLTQIPEILDANISIPLAGKKPVIGLTFVRPLYELTVNGTGYIVGENGTILALSNDVDSAKKTSLKHIQDDAPLDVTVGKTVLLASDITFLEQMYKELAAHNIQVQLATLPLGAGELYVQPQGEAYIIKFSLSGDAGQQVGAYLALLESGRLISAPTAYIDVRLGERVFVK